MSFGRIGSRSNRTLATLSNYKDSMMVKKIYWYTNKHRVFKHIFDEIMRMAVSNDCNSFYYKGAIYDITLNARKIYDVEMSEEEAEKKWGYK